jgi:nitroreductase
MIAARALGLDCGRISSFEEAAVNRLFLGDGDVQANFLCNLATVMRARFPQGFRGSRSRTPVRSDRLLQAFCWVMITYLAL